MGIHLLLLALKIIIFVVLGALAAVLFILAVILFVPFRYRVYAQKDERISGKAAVSWLFGALCAVYEADGDTGQASVRVLGVKIRRKNARGTESRYGTPPERETGNVSKPAREDSPRKEARPSHESPPASEKTFNREEPPRTTEKPERKPKTKGKKEKKSRKTGGGGVLDTLKQIWALEKKAEIAEQCVILLKRVLKAIFNLRLRADLKFGTGRPDTTGWLLGLCWAASSLAGVKINAEGDFESGGVSGRAEAEGGIFIYALVWAIILFVFNKSIFKLIKKYVFKKG